MKPRPSLPPYRVLWISPPGVLAVPVTLRDPSAATDKEVSTGLPNDVSSVTYRFPVAESSVSQLGMFPPALNCDLIASVPVLPLVVKVKVYRVPL